MSKIRFIRLIIVALVFLLIANTTYFWEPELESLGLLAIPLLGVFYIIIAAFFVRNLILLFKEKFRDRRRCIAAVVLFVVLFLTFLRPVIIDFDKLAGKNLLIAEKEGAANCMTRLKLKDNNTFVEENICWGISHIKGTWEKKGDTLLFNRIHPNRHQDEFYMYAVIGKADRQNEGRMVQHIIGGLVLYKDKKDTTGHILWITKNDFPL